MVTLREITALEEQVAQAKRTVAANLRAERVARDLSLRQVGRRVRLTPSALRNIERGKSWRHHTVQKLVRFYERTEKAATSP